MKDPGFSSASPAHILPQRRPHGRTDRGLRTDVPRAIRGPAAGAGLPVEELDGCDRRFPSGNRRKKGSETEPARHLHQHLPQGRV